MSKHNPDSAETRGYPKVLMNPLLEVLAAARVPPLWFRVYLYLLRASLGWDRTDSDKLSRRGLAKKVGTSWNKHFQETLRDMEGAGLIRLEPPMAPVLDTSLWTIGAANGSSTGAIQHPKVEQSSTQDWSHSAPQSGATHGSLQVFDRSSTGLLQEKAPDNLKDPKQKQRMSLLARQTKLTANILSRKANGLDCSKEASELDDIQKQFAKVGPHA